MKGDKHKQQSKTIKLWQNTVNQIVHHERAVERSKSMNFKHVKSMHGLLSCSCFYCLLLQHFLYFHFSNLFVEVHVSNFENLILGSSVSLFWSPSCELQGLVSTGHFPRSGSRFLNLVFLIDVSTLRLWVRYDTTKSHMPGTIQEISAWPLLKNAVRYGPLDRWVQSFLKCFF